MSSEEEGGEVREEGRGGGIAARVCGTCSSSDRGRGALPRCRRARAPPTVCIERRQINVHGRACGTSQYMSVRAGRSGQVRELEREEDQAEPAAPEAEADPAETEKGDEGEGGDDKGADDGAKDPSAKDVFGLPGPAQCPRACLYALFRVCRRCGQHNSHTNAVGEHAVGSLTRDASGDR
jgi:hypothetical protein